MAVRIYQETAITYIDYLSRLYFKHKLKDIGRGVNGVVYQHPTMPNVVVKVAKAQRGLSVGDKWLAWCKKNQTNPYVPKIYALKKLNITPDSTDKKWARIHNTSGKFTFFICFMEKLAKVSTPEFEEWVHANHLEGALLRDPETKHSFWHVADGSLSSVRDANLRKVLLAARELGKLSNTDIQPKNCLWRGTQLVFVDPVV